MEVKSQRWLNLARVLDIGVRISWEISTEIGPA
jgi:hypothetical protein